VLCSPASTRIRTVAASHDWFIEFVSLRKLFYQQRERVGRRRRGIRCWRRSRAEYNLLPKETRTILICSGRRGQGKTRFATRCRHVRISELLSLEKKVPTPLSRVYLAVFRFFILFSYATIHFSLLSFKGKKGRRRGRRVLLFSRYLFRVNAERLKQILTMMPQFLAGL